MPKPEKLKKKRRRRKDGKVIAIDEPMRGRDRKLFGARGIEKRG